jgi:ribosome-associated protein
MDLSSECIFSTSRSSGPGGQNTNKVETKIELRWNISESLLIKDTEKEKLQEELKNKISKEGFLILTSQEKRTQGQNKKVCIDKLHSLVKEALTEDKERIPTKPTKESKEARIKTKKSQSEHKRFRGNLANRDFE